MHENLAVLRCEPIGTVRMERVLTDCLWLVILCEDFVELSYRKIPKISPSKNKPPKAFFNFPLTFLQLYVTKMFTVHEKLFVFFLTAGYFLGAPDNSNIFRFPLKVRVIGSRL